MITLTRGQVRRWNAVLRRAGLSRASGSHSPATLALSRPDGTILRAWSDQVALECRLATGGPEAEFQLPHELLEACAGRSDQPVTLVRDGRRTIAQWEDGGVPQLTVGTPPKPRATPTPLTTEHTFVANEPALWTALADATQSAADRSSRFALDAIQLDGSTGEIVASDGRQLLVQRGFHLAWDDTRLIPASRLFGAREIRPTTTIDVACHEEWLGLRAAEWTVWLRQIRGRFPSTAELVPVASRCPAHLTFDERDAHYLLEVLPKLSVGAGLEESITLDLNGRVVVRAKAPDSGRVTELLLDRSLARGDRVSIATGRQYLLRALQLGLRELHVQGADKQLLTEDSQRRYLWAVQDRSVAIPTSPDAVRIQPAETPVHHSTTRRTHMPRVARDTKKRDPVATAPSSERETNANASKPSVTLPHRPPRGQATRALEQAVALRRELRDLVAQVSSLIGSLKAEQRQTKLVSSTLASLRQLERAAG